MSIDKRSDDLMTQQQPWHALSGADAAAQLESDVDAGLTESQVDRARAEHGPNVLEGKSGASIAQLALRQISSPLVWILIVAGAVAIALGKPIDGAAVLAVVLINGVFGLIQEWRAERAIDALTTMLPSTCIVIRDARRLEIPVSELVPGDLITLAAGDHVPADSRILAASHLRADEAALTGESVPVDKSPAMKPADTVLGDRTCMLYSGTSVTHGTGSALVVATAERTELGRINTMLASTDALATPLTKAMARVAQILAVTICMISALLAVVAIARGYAPADALLVGIALAVGAIPEGLPAIITIALAIGVRRAARRNALIRNLPAVETLGSTTVICSDKTGTLTKNEMTTRRIWAPDDHHVTLDAHDSDPPSCEPDSESDAINAVLRCGVLCNDAALGAEKKTKTEKQKKKTQTK